MSSMDPIILADCARRLEKHGAHDVQLRIVDEEDGYKRYEVWLETDKGLKFCFGMGENWSYGVDSRVLAHVITDLIGVALRFKQG